MLKYLIIPLSDGATSFCHYGFVKESGNLISVDALKSIIVWAQKENVSVQFLYPKFRMPVEIADIVDTIDHTDIVPSDVEDYDLRKAADIVVFNGWSGYSDFEFQGNQAYVMKTTLLDLISHDAVLKARLSELSRLNIMITDVPSMTGKSLDDYGKWIESLIPSVVAEYANGHAVQLNILTDILTLNEPNDCRAGEESLTFAPDGKFYICPAFYTFGLESAGDIENGINIKNAQLYQRDHAPICRICDAYQCKRCVWLNRNLTHELNTPGRQQCVMAHIERNASKKLLEELRKLDSNYLYETNIPEIDYLDPFDKLMRKQ